MNSLEKINKCIEQLENMTQEEFDKIVTKKSIDKKEYKKENYVGGNFSIILPGEKGKKNIKQIEIMSKLNLNSKISFSNEIIFDTSSEITIGYNMSDCIKNIKTYEQNFVLKSKYDGNMIKIKKCQPKDNIFKDDIELAEAV